MRPSWVMSMMLATAALASAQLVRAQGTDAVLYTLGAPPSEFDWGCFAPCMCPIFIRSPLTGAFTLRHVIDDPLFANYDVLDVHWRVEGASGPVAVTGSGTYRRGGEVAVLEELAHDLSFDGGPPRHFDSGLRAPGAPFPEISTRISLRGEYCLDSLLIFDAKPFDPAAVVGTSPDRIPLLAVPNPFRASTDLAFTLAVDAVVDLDVFDIGGRRLRALAHQEPLPAGLHSRAWDGTLADGRRAPPGLYVIRLATSVGEARRTVARIQ